MKHHRLLTMLVVLVAAMTAWASPRSYQDALAIARQHATLLGATVEIPADSLANARFFKAIAAGRPQSGKSLSQDRNSFSQNENGLALDSDALTRHLYLFTHAAGKGFTIVSRDDQMPALVAYADKGTFDGAELADGFRFFLQAYNAFAEAVQRGDAQAARQLTELKAARQGGKAGHMAVSPLMNTEWGQNGPYNDMCPSINGQRAVTGCVATAMAQILVATNKRRPLQATIPAYTTTTHHISMPSVPAGTTYDWDHMLANYTTSRYTDQQAQAVAKLVYHVGLANEMDYTPSGSGAYSSLEPFVKYFGYDPDLAQRVYRTSYTLEQWHHIIDSELQARRPVYVSGRSSSGGHAFVCDGADGQGLYHINWGWDGYQNGYFDMAVLNPAKGGTGSGSSTDGYVQDLSLLVGLAPDNGVTDEPLYTTDLSPLILMWGSDFDLVGGTSFRKDGKFTFKVVSSVANPTGQGRAFDWAIGIRNADGTYQPVSEVKEAMLLPAVTSTGAMSCFTNIAFTCSYNMPEGHYPLYGIARETGSGIWKALGNPNAILLPELEVDQFTLRQVTHQDQLAATLTPQGEMLHGREGVFALTLTNLSGNQYLGSVDIYLSGSSDMANGRVAHTRYQCLQGYESVTVPVSLALGEAGNEYAWVVAGGNTLAGPLLVEEADPKVPKLSLVDITTNESDFIGGLTVNNREIATPYIDDDHALIAWHIRNDGYATTAGYGLQALNPFTGEVKRIWQRTASLPGDGAVTPVQFSVPASVATSGCVMVKFYGFDDDKPLTFACQQGIHYADNFYDDSDVYRPGDGLYLYAISGNPTGILSPDADASARVAVVAGAGSLVITTPQTRRVDVYSVGGQRVATAWCQAGVPRTLAVPPGLYVVDGRKVAVCR